MLSKEEQKALADNNVKCESEMKYDTVTNAASKATTKTNEEKAQEKKRNKKYYFLKLPSGFSGSDAMYTLYSSADNREEGLLMQYCYLRMLELSIKSEGLLKASPKYPFTPKTLSLALGGFNEELVCKVVNIMSECGFVTLDDDATIIMNQLPELIASSSEQAIQKRNERLTKQQSEAEKAEIEKIIKLAKTNWLKSDK